MKFAHLSDLHLGLRLNEYSLIEDQAYILQRIVELIDSEQVDGVLLAGDIYDKTVAPTEAVKLFDDFLYALAQKGRQVFIISGNHDSPERIAFGGRMMQDCGIHISPVYDGTPQPITMQDDYGKLNVWLLPFVKPLHVKRLFDEPIESYTDAMRVAISHMEIDENERNLLVTHQFVTGADRTESEDIMVGGTDNVSVDVFAPFDYTALGHIHRAQNCKSERVRYSGTPLKYSFSEVNDQKSITIVELKEKGSLSVKEIPLVPLRNLVKLRGTYNQLMSRAFYQGTTYAEDYTSIVLTDEEDIPEAMGKLRTVYHKLMMIDYDNVRTRTFQQVGSADEVEKKQPIEHFATFYEKQNNQPMTEEQRALVEQMIEEIWGANE